VDDTTWGSRATSSMSIGVNPKVSTLNTA